MITWLEVMEKPLRAVEHAAHENDDVFETVMVGPRTWQRIDYPVAEVIPDSVSRSGGHEFTARVRAHLYFERDREYEFVDDVLHPVAGVVTDALDAADATTCIGGAVPSNIDFFAGELDNTAILLVSVEFEIQTLVDLAE